MKYKIELYIASAWVDVSEYIVSLDGVPLTKINNDYTFSAEGFGLDVVNTIPYDIQNAKDVKVSKFDGSSWVAIFLGFSDGVNADVQNDTFRVKVLNIIFRLKKFTVDYDTLHSDLVNNNASGSNDYVASDNKGYPNLRIVYLIKRMFTIALAGYQTAFDFVVPGLILKDKTIKNPNLSDYGTFDFYFNEIRIDENMLYAVNQNVATNHGRVDGDPDLIRSKITFWDFLQQVFSDFSVFLSVSNGNLHAERIVGENYENPYQIADEYIFHKEERVNKADDERYFILREMNCDRGAYTTDNLDDIDTVLVEGYFHVGSQIPFLKNLAYLLQVKNTDSDVYGIYSVSGTGDNASYKTNQVLAEDLDGGGRKIKFRAINSKTKNKHLFEIVTSPSLQPQVVSSYRLAFEKILDLQNNEITIKSGGYYDV